MRLHTNGFAAITAGAAVSTLGDGILEIMSQILFRNVDKGACSTADRAYIGVAAVCLMGALGNDVITVDTDEPVSGSVEAVLVVMIGRSDIDAL